MWNVIRPAVVSFALLTLLTGAIYPAVVTLIAQVAFPYQANGSLISIDGHVAGSGLIAQPFSDAKYFWPRPSAANYDATAGSGSNLGPTNPALVDAVRVRIDVVRKSGTAVDGPVPVDLITASASGLDPHVSPAAALVQAARVAAARKLSVTDVRRLIDRCTEAPTAGILGEARVNVLGLNLLLDHGESNPSSITGVRAYGFLPTAK